MGNPRNRRGLHATWDTISAEVFDSGENGSAQEEGTAKYVVLDLETHDWRNGEQMSRSRAIGKIVEIAWMAFDEKGRELESKCYLLKPHDGYYARVSDKARECHGITTRCAEENGCDAKVVFAHFSRLLQQVPKDGFVIAHNMRHEDAIMFTNLNQEQRKLWDSTPKCCTLQPRLLHLLPGARERGLLGRDYGLKLTELYKEINSSGGVPLQLIRHHHSALADVQMAWSVFWFYKCAVDDNKNTSIDMAWHGPSMSRKVVVTGVQPRTLTAKKRRTEI